MFCTAGQWWWGVWTKVKGIHPRYSYLIFVEDQLHGSVFRRPFLAPAFDYDYRMAGKTFEKQRTNPKNWKRYLKCFKIRPKWFFFNYHKKTLFFSNSNSWCLFFELQGLAGRPEWGTKIVEVGKLECKSWYICLNLNFYVICHMFIESNSVSHYNSITVFKMGFTSQRFPTENKATYKDCENQTTDRTYDREIWKLW